MNLLALQHDFRNRLTAAAPPAASPASPGLAVYRNNYRVQLVGCLEQTFPCLRAFVGDDVFRQAAAAHVARHPPHAWTLDAYGERFGDTLAHLYPDNPDVHELAWIEWAMNTAFVAPDAAPLDPATLASVDWDRATLAFAPSLRLAPLATNAADIWSAQQEGRALPEAAMLSAPGGVLVWRRGFTVRLRVLDEATHDALAHARKHGRFDALCALLVAQLGEEAGPAQAGALLADWIGGDIVVAVTDGASSTLTIP